MPALPERVSRHPRADRAEALGTNAPSAIEPRLLNDVGRELGWPTIDASLTTPMLPEIAVCPFRAQYPIFESPDYSFAAPYWITGYQYVGRAADTPNAFGSAVQPGRIADARGRHRGVLWADTLALTIASGNMRGYSSFHTAGGQTLDPQFGTIQQRKPLQGQHRAWNDGSVEWIRADLLDLDPAHVATQASYRASIPGVFDLWYFF